MVSQAGLNFEHPHVYEADEVLRSFGLSEDDNKKREVQGTLRRNIFKRARFNMRIQGENKPVDAFICTILTLWVC